MLYQQWFMPDLVVRTFLAEIKGPDLESGQTLGDFEEARCHPDKFAGPLTGQKVIYIVIRRAHHIYRSLSKSGSGLNVNNTRD
jgi:hypothetical protein